LSSRSSPAGCVYLRFSWMPAPSLFSSVGLYHLVVIAALVYLQFTWGNAPPPLCGGLCLMSVTVGSLSLSKSTGGGYATPTFSGWLVYLQFAGEVLLPYSLAQCASQGRPPPPFSRAQDAPPSLLLVLFCSCLLFSFLLFFFFFLQGRGQSVQGTMLIFPRGGCGSTACHLFAHLLVCQAG
jgi:hypothetical protein